MRKSFLEFEQELFRNALNSALKGLQLCIIAYDRKFEVMAIKNIFQ